MKMMKMMALTVAAGTALATLTPSEQDHFVAVHNRFRGAVQPPAKDMMALYWDDGLAASAQVVADSCPTNHSTSGENIAWGWPSMTTDEAFKKWTDQRVQFDEASSSCKGQDCSRYTQIVFAKAESIGCAHAKCNSFGQSNVQTYVCLYRAVNNVANSAPYAHGASCSSCPRGYTCNSNLCVNAASTIPVFPDEAPPASEAPTMEPAVSTAPTMAPTKTLDDIPNQIPIKSSSQQHDRYPEELYPAPSTAPAGSETAPTASALLERSRHLVTPSLYPVASPVPTIEAMTADVTASPVHHWARAPRKNATRVARSVAPLHQPLYKSEAPTAAPTAAPTTIPIHVSDVAPMSITNMLINSTYCDNSTDIANATSS